MPGPLRQKSADRRGPLEVERVEIEYPAAYLPGDRYEVVFVLTRALDPYEERAAKKEDLLPGSRFEEDQLIVRAWVDDLDPRRVAELLRRITAKANEWRTQADADRSRLAGRCATILRDVRQAR